VKVFAHGFVHKLKMAQIREKHIEFSDVRKIAASGMDNRLEIFEYATNLRLHVARYQVSSSGIEWNLSGDIHGVAALNGLAVGADGLWGVGRADNSSVHKRVLAKNSIGISIRRDQADPIV
jgi:hypothetical protein